MDSREASTLVFDAIAYGVAGDSERAADNLTKLGIQGDNRLMYAACCSIAEAGKLMLVRLNGGRVVSPEQGDMWVLEQLQPGALDRDPAGAFAVRFLIAHANGDHSTTQALFAAAVRAHGEQYIDSVCALLADVVGITRLALDQQS
ncbi:hypothetical protein C9F11_37580 [Streptomyces sp. YIM 121038]|uniref:hypothetical protein n=1 Tax=Streptomyces sp. YIM 121038 TaxID=2136401 RepID=UPI001110EBBD|nr:hypothetical protein [Streptomyces sp. YIM 121038]QCX81099.1 hypothetical protein C9F11_37580 [Streptomyces sp. YIM 121038]